MVTPRALALGCLVVVGEEGDCGQGRQCQEGQWWCAQDDTWEKWTMFLSDMVGLRRLAGRAILDAGSGRVELGMIVSVGQ